MPVKVLKVDERHVFFMGRGGKVSFLFLFMITHNPIFLCLKAHKALDKLIVTVKKKRRQIGSVETTGSGYLILDVCVVKPVTNLENLTLILYLIDGWIDSKLLLNFAVVVFLCSSIRSALLLYQSNFLLSCLGNPFE
jgi:hypothetical protein